jgi:hypothetical protein
MDILEVLANDEPMLTNLGRNDVDDLDIYFVPK